MSSFTEVKNIAILGSTGSIGVQTLEIIRQFPEQYRVIVLTAQNNTVKLIEQALEFRPEAVVIGCKNSWKEIHNALNKFGIEVYAGVDELNQIVEMPGIEMVVNALVGFAGLAPAINALKTGKHLALANKESLVAGGKLLIHLSKSNHLKIIPIDSEHSAIFQCLIGEKVSNVEKIYLTATGGPFYGWSRESLENVTPAEALKHPKWKMGQKISIDSATLMNKGLEVIEARWLFDLPPDKIEVLIHPEAIIHSMVQFVDGSIKAQMAPADMRIPIQFALSYPHRQRNNLPRVDFNSLYQLTFSPPDRKTFRNLDLAYIALKKDGNMPCILNAANEIAVEMFLKGKITFTQIPEIIEQSMTEIPYIEEPDFNDLVTTHRTTKSYAARIANEFIKSA